VTGRRGRRCKKLLFDLKEKRGYSKLKEEELALEKIMDLLLDRLQNEMERMNHL
jgi:hypothetical protein